MLHIARRAFICHTLCVAELVFFFFCFDFSIEIYVFTLEKYSGGVFRYANVNRDESVVAVNVLRQLDSPCILWA